MNTLVLLHGFLGSSRTFDRVVQSLGRPALALDLGEPFFESEVLSEALDAEADRILGRLLKEGIETFDLLGYSLGGRVAMHVARRAPDRVDRLILESAHPGLESATERKERCGNDARWAERIRTIWPGILEDWYAQPVFRSIQQTPLVRTLIEEKSVRDPVGAAQQLEAWSLGRQASLWPFLEQRNRPALFISGEMDTRYSSIGERLATRSGPIRHIEIAGAGHVVHREQPDAYLAALRTFL